MLACQHESLALTNHQAACRLVEKAFASYVPDHYVSSRSQNKSALALERPHHTKNGTMRDVFYIYNLIGLFVATRDCIILRG